MRRHAAFRPRLQADRDGHDLEGPVPTDPGRISVTGKERVQAVKWVNWISIGIIGLIVFVNLGDLASYLSSPTQYHFGTEVAGLRYRSEGHFIGWILTVAAIGAGAIASGVFIKRYPVAAAIRVGVAVMLLAASLGYLTT